MPPVWSSQQDAALVAVSAWLKDRNGPQVFRLFGWAGTGKSTLAVHLAQDVRSVKYAAFTGKAAMVMRKRGCKGAQTIHSLIYTLVSEKEGEPRFVLDPESPAADADLIVIDALTASEAKTKGLAASLGKLGITNALFIGGNELDSNFRLAAKNIPNVDVLPVQGINVYDILRRGKLVLSKDAIAALEERFK